MNKMKALVATTLVTLGIFALPLFSGANRVAADIILDAKLSVNDKVVERGQTLIYTFRVENNTGVDGIGDILFVPGRQPDTNHAFSPYVDYILGSSSFEDSNGKTGALDDNWVLLGGPDNPNHVLNMGKLNDGEWFEFTFKAKVRNDAPNNAFIESIVFIFPNADTAGIQCAASSTLKVGEVLGAELPETGASDVFAISGYALYLGVLLRKLKLNKYL